MAEPPGDIGRPAGPADRGVLARCLASAFWEDPVWGHWSFPDERAREGGLHRLLDAWASGPVPHGWVRMTPASAAVAVWVPPGVAEMTEQQEQAFELLTNELFGARAGELRTVFGEFEANHPRAEPHYYLSLWGTHAGHRGKGIGARLLDANLAEIDAQGMPVYLESTNPVNLPRYEALGFERRDEFGPPGGPVVTSMWRAARP